MGSGSLGAYWRRVLHRTLQDVISSGREQVIGVLMAAGILFYQVKFGLIAQAQISANAWALFYPYLYLIGAFVVFHFVLAPWRLDQELRKELAHVKTELNQFGSRTKECVARAREFLLVGFLLKQSVPGAIRDTPKDTIEEWKNKAMQWRKDTTAFLETCSSLAAQKFNGKLGIDATSGPLFNVHNDLQSQFDYLRQRVDILNEIIEKQDVYFG